MNKQKLIEILWKRATEEGFDLDTDALAKALAPMEESHNGRVNRLLDLLFDGAKLARVYYPEDLDSFFHCLAKVQAVAVNLERAVKAEIAYEESARGSYRVKERRRKMAGETKKRQALVELQRLAKSHGYHLAVGDLEATLVPLEFSGENEERLLRMEQAITELRDAFARQDTTGFAQRLATLAKDVGSAWDTIPRNVQAEIEGEGYADDL